MDGKKDVVFIADNNYAQHTAVVIVSIVRNCGERLRVWLLASAFDEGNKKKYGELASSFGIELHIVQFDTSLVDAYDNIGPWPKYTFMKLYIAKYLPECCKKCLYLDSDLVVLGNIQPLFSVDMGENAVAGVSDTVGCVMHKRRCGLPAGAAYINSGVMVLNLDCWREELRKLSFEMFIEHNKGKISICDQDVINSVFEGKILELHLKYNVTSACFGLNPWRNLLPSVRPMLKEARKNPVVVHFVNSGKPWIKEFYHPFKVKYYFYLRQTPYRDFKPQYKDGGVGKMVYLWFRGQTMRLIDAFRF